MQLILLFLYALHFYVVTMHSENALLQFKVNKKNKVDQFDQGVIFI